MHGVKANARVRMHNARIRDPAVEHRAIAIPAHAPRTAAAHCFPPQPEESMPEPPERSAVAWYRVILVITALHTSQPLTDLRQRLMHPASQLPLQLLQFRAHPFARRLTPNDEPPLLGAT